MYFLDSISNNGYIKLKPADSLGREGYVEVEWFKEAFEGLAEEQVPLTEDAYNQLKSIDKFWKENAERWRSEGLI